MDSLKQLFREREIEELVEQNKEIKVRKKEDIRRILKLLADQKCTNKELRNIIKINPFVLTRNPDALEELIYKLKEYKVLHVNKVFDCYPYITNKYAYEIDTFFFIKQKEGLDDKEIIKILEEEPYQIDMTTK